jgi:hypothetical protein
MGGACSTDGRCEKLIESFWSENLKGKDHSEDINVEGRIILERILGEKCGKLWTALIWFRIGTSDGLL